VSVFGEGERREVKNRQWREAFKYMKHKSHKSPIRGLDLQNCLPNDRSHIIIVSISYQTRNMAIIVFEKLVAGFQHDGVTT